VSEARSSHGEYFGAQRLREILHDTTGSPQSVVNAIKRAVREHEASGRMRDDQSLIATGIE